MLDTNLDIYDCLTEKEVGVKCFTPNDRVFYDIIDSFVNVVPDDERPLTKEQLSERVDSLSFAATNLNNMLSEVERNLTRQKEIFSYLQGAENVTEENAQYYNALCTVVDENIKNLSHDYNVLKEAVGVIEKKSYVYSSVLSYSNGTLDPKEIVYSVFASEIVALKNRIW